MRIIRYLDSKGNERYGAEQKVKGPVTLVRNIRSRSSGDQRVRIAHAESVKVALAELEQFAACRSKESNIKTLGGVAAFPNAVPHDKAIANPAVRGRWRKLQRLRRSLCSGPFGWSGACCQALPCTAV